MPDNTNHWIIVLIGTCLHGQMTICEKKKRKEKERKRKKKENTKNYLR